MARITLLALVPTVRPAAATPSTALSAAPTAPDAGAGDRPQLALEIESGRTTIVQVQPPPGTPIEREAEFEAKIPSYRRAIAMDRERRWAEAAGHYQEALIEVGNAVRFGANPKWEQAAFKIELERRRSQLLGHDGTEPGASPSDRRFGPTGSRRAVSPRLAPLERGRLLRLKLMSVRAASGAAPGDLVSATLAALSAAVRPSPRPLDPGSDAEARLLLCATRAVAGDRPGARLELAHVAAKDRSDPNRALGMAVCQAALHDYENALASLAVGVFRLGPASRFLPGPNRELQSANDWDGLRRDPRFERIFR